jgi:hypothetical protein
VDTKRRISHIGLVLAQPTTRWQWALEVIAVGLFAGIRTGKNI